jgi:outer membrane protein OmpA-like peptidoglycan-associated protein
MASNRPGGVGNFDIYTFSLMSNETAIASLNRSKGAHSPDLAYLRDYKLDYFPKEDQLRIDRLVSRKKTEHLYQVDLLLTKEEDAFYRQLSNQEKKTIDLAARHLFEQMNLPEQQEAKTRDEQLFQLSPPNDQTRLSRMADAHRQAAVSQTTLPYSDADARYYEGLSLPEKKLLDGILASQLRNQGPNNGAVVAALPEQDKFKYEKLPLNEKSRIDRIAAARLARMLGNATAQLSEEDEQFYAALTPEEKAAFDKLVNAKMAGMLAQQKGLRPGDFDYAHLPLEDQQRINRIAAARRAALRNNQPLPLSQEDQLYYNQLSKEEKAKFDQLVEAKMNQLAGQEKKNPFEGFNYEQLPLEERNRINRVAAAWLARLQGNENARLSEADEQFYAALTPEEKAAFDRLVKEKMAEMLIRQKGLGPAAFDYQHLPLEEQQRINRIAAARRAALLNNQPVQLSQEDQLYYNQLSKAEKAKLDQMVEVKMTQLTGQEKKNPFEGFHYELLPLEERKRIDRIVAARRAALQNNRPLQLSQEDQRYYDQLSDQDKQQIDRMVAAQSPSSLARVKAGPPRTAPKISESRASEAVLHTFQTGNFKSISLKGQVLQADTALPVKGLEVLLVNEAGVPEKWTTTDAKGRFQYIRLSPDKQYSIQVNEPPVRLTQPSSYRMKDLQMWGYEEKVSDIRHEPVYFDFNRYAIRPEARQVLEALIALCRANPDIQIEINAFTDPIGSKEYNLELSRKRGREVQHYLVEHGINPNALVMRYQGEDGVRYGTNQAAGHQANRRVEFMLKGAPTGYQSDVYTYIMQAKSTVSSLAKLFGMTVQELKGLNDFTSDTVDAYRPVRVRNHRKVTPALLLRPEPGKKARPK